MHAKTKILNNNQGIALVLSLMVMLFLLTFSSILILSVFTQNNLIRRESNLIRAHYLAQAGAHAGLNRLNILINSYLLSAVNSSNVNTFASEVEKYVSFHNNLWFLKDYIKDSGISQFEVQDGFAIHTGTLVSINGGQYQYVIRIRSKGSPQTIAAQIWDFSYYFTIESTGSVTDSKQKILCSGDFLVRVQKDSFSKHVLFANADFNKKQSGEDYFVASTSDITDKLTWQNGQP